jgi:hypothetical protein
MNQGPQGPVGWEERYAQEPDRGRPVAGAIGAEIHNVDMSKDLEAPIARQKSP